MTSLRGDLDVADAHVHFFSHRFFSTLAAQKGGLAAADLAPLLGWEVPPPDPEALAARWVAELDRHGVRRAVLIASVPGDAASVLAAHSLYPHRFAGYFLLDPTAADAPLHAASALAAGMRGICFFPAMQRYSMQSPEAASILDVAAAFPGTEIFVHCGVLTVGVRRKLGLPSPFDMTFSNPLQLHAVALRFPQLTFVVPHFGAGYLREALMLCDLCPNVLLDTSSSNSWMRYEGLTLETVFRRALDVVGPARLRFGSDSSFFPRGWNSSVFEAQWRALAALGLSASDTRAVFGGNLTF